MNKKAILVFTALFLIPLVFASVDFTPIQEITFSETDTLQSVTDRGAVTDKEVTINNNLNVDGNVGIGTPASLYGLDVSSSSPFNTAFFQARDGSDGRTKVIIQAGEADTGSDGLLEIRNKNGLIVSRFRLDGLVSGNTLSTADINTASLTQVAGYRRGLNLNNIALVTWSSTNRWFDAKDTGISRVSEGVVAIGNAEVGDSSGTLLVDSIGLGGVNTPNQKLQIDGSINASGTVYASAFISHSPIRLGEDSDVGYTRLCYKATNGDVVLKEIQLINGNYENVYIQDLQGICDRAIIKESIMESDIKLVEGIPKKVSIEKRTFETLYSKQQSTEIIRTIRNELIEWNIDIKYGLGDIFQYQGKGYEVIQEHTSQEDWKPNEVSSLYKKLILHEYNEVTEWVQPQGSHDCYPLGAIVTYNGKKYESTHSCNVWQPPTLWSVVE